MKEMNDKPIIRFAEKKDIDRLVELCADHAAYEQSEYDSKGKGQQLANDLFSPSPKLYCLVVEWNEQLIGYATYMKQYATWDAAEYIYMDWLYLSEAARGHGTGEALVERIKAEGSKLGCSLVQWPTPDLNVRAIKFYNRIGASSQRTERLFLDITA